MKKALISNSVKKCLPTEIQSRQAKITTSFMFEKLLLHRILLASHNCSAHPARLTANKTMLSVLSLCYCHIRQLLSINFIYISRKRRYDHTISQSLMTREAT